MHKNAAEGLVIHQLASRAGIGQHGGVPHPGAGVFVRDWLAEIGIVLQSWRIKNVVPRTSRRVVHGSAPLQHASTALAIVLNSFLKPLLDQTLHTGPVEIQHAKYAAHIRLRTVEVYFD